MPVVRWSHALGLVTVDGLTPPRHTGTKELAYASLPFYCVARMPSTGVYEVLHLKKAQALGIPKVEHSAFLTHSEPCYRSLLTAEETTAAYREASKERRSFQPTAVRPAESDTTLSWRKCPTVLTPAADDSIRIHIRIPDILVYGCRSDRSRLGRDNEKYPIGRGALLVRRAITTGSNTPSSRLFTIDKLGLHDTMTLSGAVSSGDVRRECVWYEAERAGKPTQVVLLPNTWVEQSTVRIGGRVVPAVRSQGSKLRLGEDTARFGSFEESGRGSVYSRMTRDLDQADDSGLIWLQYYNLIEEFVQAVIQHYVRSGLVTFPTAKGKESTEETEPEGGWTLHRSHNYGKSRQHTVCMNCGVGQTTLAARQKCPKTSQVLTDGRIVGVVTTGESS